MRKISNELLVNALLEYSDKIGKATKKVCDKIDNEHVKVDTSELKKLLEQSEKSIAYSASKIQEKEDRFTLYWKMLFMSVCFCLIGIGALFISYKTAFESKQEYRQGLEKEYYIISKEDNPKLKPFMQSVYINGLYDAYLNGEVSDQTLLKEFKTKAKQHPKPPEKSVGDLFLDELKSLF